MRVYKIVSALFAAVLFAAVTGCAPQKPNITVSADAVAAAAVVRAIDNRFEPREVTIKVGEAVRWEFQGGAKHDVVAKDGQFVSDLLKTGSFTHVFTQPGVFKYDCSIHPEMVGVVRVVE